MRVKQHHFRAPESAHGQLISRSRGEVKRENGAGLGVCGRYYKPDGTYEFSGEACVQGGRPAQNRNRQRLTGNGKLLTARKRRGLANVGERIGARPRKSGFALDRQPFAKASQHELERRGTRGKPG
jgi:hypothetical protein